MTLLSTNAEWHALSVGFVVGAYYGATGDVRPLAVCLAYATGLQQAPYGHLSDLVDESGYFASGAVVGAVVGRLARRFD